MAIDELPDARVLVIEDDESNRLLVKRILERVGISGVRFAEDVGRIAATVEAFDPNLVLIDMHLGGVDGIEVLGQLSAHCRDGMPRKVLMLTGDTSAELSLRAKAAGADAVLHKPYMMDELIDAVTTLIATG